MSTIKVTLKGSLLLLIIVATTSANGIDDARDVNGGWSKWGGTEPCSKSCNGGEKKEHRLCSDPYPANKGTLCQKDDNTFGKTETRTIKCNQITCFDNKWTNWTECPNCTLGERTRSPLCGEDICAPEVKEPEIEDCNAWNKTICPDPCDDVECPKFSSCNNTSTEEAPSWECVCVLGYKMNSAKTDCIRPPPVPPTPRPIPVLPAAQKTVATVVSKTASTILIVFVSFTLFLFGALRIFTPDRVIQMNMEISLLLGHIFLVLPPSLAENPDMCRLVSIAIHFFFTACYIFIMLEALHMYSLVAHVVRKDGMFTRFQNIVIGWGLAAFIVIVCVCFEFDYYGGEYHCWLRMDTPLLFAQVTPIIIFSTVTITLIEGAGSATSYKPLKSVDSKQRLSAKFSQRTNLILLPFMLAHWVLGMLSEYEQNLALYGTFSVINGIFGVLVFFLHVSNNDQVREKLKSYLRSMKGQKPTEE